MFPGYAKVCEGVSYNHEIKGMIVSFYERRENGYPTRGLANQLALIAEAVDSVRDEHDYEGPIFLTVRGLEV